MARKSKTQVVLKVSMMLPGNVTLQQAQAYVKQSVLGYLDYIDPGQAIKELDKEKVKVSLDSRHTYY